MGLTILCGIFFIFGLNDEIFSITLSVPHNVVMNLNDVMTTVVTFTTIYLLPCDFHTKSYPKHRKTMYFGEWEVCNYNIYSTIQK